MNRAFLRFCLACLFMLAMNGVSLAICNCCCKQLKGYGYERGGGNPTSCWGTDNWVTWNGTVVDSGTCIHVEVDEGTSTLLWEYDGCSLLCSGNLPPTAPANPLSESDSAIPDTAVSIGTRKRGRCQAAEGTQAPSTACG